MQKACERYPNAIQELADGTLGPIRRAELNIHLDECESCRRLADDLSRIHALAASLDRPAPPERVWSQIAGRLRQEGRVAPPPARAGAQGVTDISRLLTLSEPGGQFPIVASVHVRR